MPARSVARPLLATLLVFLAVSQSPPSAQAPVAGQLHLVTGAGEGGGPHVQTFDIVTGGLLSGQVGSFYAYIPWFTGGVRVATCDVTGDAIPDIITGAGPSGSPLVRVFDGQTGNLVSLPLNSFYGLPVSFEGGVFVACGDVSGDGVPDVIVGSGAGGESRVRVFDLTTGTQMAGPIGSFLAYTLFTGGVRVASCDLSGDGRADIVTGAGPGSLGPLVRVFDAVTGAQLPAPLGSFYALDRAVIGGVFVACADVTGDGVPDIVAGQGALGEPRVRVFDGVTGTQIPGPLGSFLAFEQNFSGGVKVAACDLTGDGVAELVFGRGPSRTPQVRILNGATGAELPGGFGSFNAYNAGFRGGVFVACPVSTETAPRVSSTTPADDDTNVPDDSDLVVTFSEPVVATANAFALECPAATPIPLTTTTVSPATQFTLTPSTRLPVSTLCTLTVVATEVSDQDGDDPPDLMFADHTVSFTTSTCPTITVTSSVMPVPGGMVTVPYGPITFNQTGSGGPITWTTTGALPPGLTVSALGVLSGTPTQTGSFDFTVVANAPAGCSGSLDLTVNIASGPNQPPSFTAGANQTVLEDAGAQTVANWATAISPGAPADEAGQTVTFTVTPSNAALFSAGPAISSSGTLTFTPAANANGTATITVTLSDNGGTAGGGDDTSDPQTFTITITAVNDAPSFVKGADQVVSENAGAQIVANWATSISAGAANESTQILTFGVTTNNAPLFSAGPAISSTGVLTYTPAPSASGTATVTVVLRDDGGTTNGGVDASAPQTFTIGVSAVNDPPVAMPDAGTTDEDTVLTVAAPGVLGNDIDPDPADVRIVSAVNGVPANVGTPTTLASGATLTVNADGSYVYNPTAVATFQALGQGQSTTDSFNYTMQDVGALPSTATVTITINGVNDVAALDLDLDDDGGTTPTIGNDFAITISDGDPPQLIEDEADATITDVDSPNLTSITVTVTNVLDDMQEKLDVDLVTGGFAANFTKNLDEATAGVAVLTIMATTPRPLAEFVTLLRRVTYQNLELNPDTTAARTITVVVNDGVGDSNTATSTVTIVAGDDPPTADNDSYNVDEGGTLTIAAPGVLDGDTDPEGDTPITAVLVTGPANASSFTLNSNGSFTYTHDGSETTTDSFTYRAAANGLQSAPATVTITINAVNDAPVITAGAALIFAEGSLATAIDTTILVTDGDDTNLESATVQIFGGYANGQDILAMPATPGIAAVFNGLTGTLTLTGSAPVAVYQNALRSVTYFNNSVTPATTPRTVNWIVNDGTTASNTAVSTITVLSLNSSPTGGTDTFETFGNTELRVDAGASATPHVLETTAGTNGVLANDFDIEGDAVSVAGLDGPGCGVGVFTCATAGGGTVTIQTNGSFTYTPQAGDVTSDSFVYILRDNPATGVPSVTNVSVNITLHGRIWYVDGNAAGPGTGTSADPFSALPATVGDADDYIFVHDSTLTGGITLQNGQKLYGEGFGLSINQSLNGNPAPAVIVAPGASPEIQAASGNSVSVLANTANGSLTNVEVRGVTLSTTAASSNAIDITSADAANIAVIISDVVITGATAEGIDINQASSGTATVSISGVTVTSNGTGIDLNESGGTLTVTGFNGVTITGNTGGSGIIVTNATFDAAVGGGYNQVAGGATAVGESGNPVGGAGVVLTNVSGALAFTDLDIFSANGAALQVSGTGAVNGAAGTGTLVSVAAGVSTLQSIGGPVVDVNTATVNLPLDSASVTSSPTTGISLVNVADGTTAASVSAASGSIAGTTGIAVYVSGGTVSLNYGGNITQSSNAAMVSVSGGHTTGTITFSGTLNATNGSGLVFDNADSTTSYNFTGTTTLNGGDAGIDILNGSAGTFTFGTGTAITNPSGTAFAMSASPANVTYSGTISDNTGFAVDINGLTAGTATFQTGSITSTGAGIRVVNSTGGVINFTSPTIALTTGTGTAVNIGSGGPNTGGTINFAPAGGNGLDISTTTGLGFLAQQGGTVTVSGTGNTITSTGGMAIELSGVMVGAGGVNFASTSSGGGTRNVKLTNVTGGAIALGGGTLSGATGAAFLVGDGAGGANTGGTAAVSYSGTITSTGAARAVDIQDRTAAAGSIVLSGTITHSSGNANVIFLDGNRGGTNTFSGANSVLNGGTSTAVSLTDNAGATISFIGGGLDIDATSGGGFVATGGGTVIVTATGNTITTTTGTALNVANTTIGASGLRFQSISANGATKGISLNATGAGTFTVTGTGAAGTGGTIQNTTGRGAEFISMSGAISLTGMNFTNAGSTDGPGGPGCQEPIGGDTTQCNAGIHLQTTSGGVSLNTIHVDGGAQAGINGLSVTNLTMNNVEVENVGNNSLENGVLLKNTLGTGSITNSTFHHNAGKQLHMYNNTGTLTSFNITDSNFSDTVAPNGAQGVLIYADNSATMTVNTGTGAGDGNTFANLFSFAWQALAANNAQLTANLRNGTMTNTNSIVVQASLSSRITTTIDSNNWTAGANTAAGPLSLKTDGGGDMDAVVTSNIFGQTGVVGSGTPASCGNCPGMFINPRFDSDSTFDIRGNIIQQITGSGIAFQPGESSAANAVQATITGNLIRGPMDSVTPQAIVVTNGVTSGPPADNTCLRLTLGGSVTPGAWPSLVAGARNRIENDWSTGIAGGEVFLFQRFSTTFNLAGYPGTGVGAYVQTQNSIQSTTGAQASSVGTFGNGTCTP